MHKGNPCRYFIARQLTLGKRNQFLLSGVLIVFEYDPRLEAFLPDLLRIWMRNSRYTNFSYGGMFGKHFLNRCWINVEAADQRHILLAINDVKIAILVHA